MSTKDFNIPSPCSTSWDSMIGNDRVRFCEHCQLSVHNLDLTSRKQLRRLIARSDGRLCVFYLQPLAPVLYKIGRRTSKIAASAFSAALGLSSAAIANANPKVTAFPHEVVSAARLVDQDSGTGTLRGYIYDPNGAVITFATVSLINSETNEQVYAVSSSAGEYRFEGLKPGVYRLKINARGFDDSEVPNITVRSDENNRVDQTLSIEPVIEEVTVVAPEEARQEMSGGAVAVVTPSHPLVKAAMEDDLEKLKEVLLTTPDPNVRDNDTQDTALEHAVRNGNREMVQVLLWAKADVNAKDGDGQTVLMMLSEKVTSEIIWDLINAGAKVNLRDEDGDTALIAASEVNNVDALKTLLDAGAKVNASNNDGETAVMRAASNGEVNNIRALIFGGADVNARDKQGKTALMHAIDNKESTAARFLKSHGAIEFPEPEKP